MYRRIILGKECWDALPFVIRTYIKIFGKKKKSVYYELGNILFVYIDWPKKKCGDFSK